MTQNQFMPESVFVPHFGKDTELIGVEIGVLTACGSVALLNNLPNLKLYCVDPWRHFDQAFFEAGRDQSAHDLNFEHARNRLLSYGDRAVIVRKTSDEALMDIPLQVDFVHIDGHHEFYQVVRDIVNYLPRVKRGGIISGHDYIQVPDVTWAVDRLFPKEKIHTGEDFTWWVYV